MKRKNKSNRKRIAALLMLAVSVGTGGCSATETGQSKESKGEIETVETIYQDSFATIQEDGIEKYGEGFKARYMPAYLDDDEIPELLVAWGEQSPFGVSVYRQDTTDGTVHYVGTFSSGGEIQFVPRKNRIASDYGNHGYFLTCYSEIQGNGVRLVDATLSDASGFRGEEILYYHGFTLAEDVNGTRDCLEGKEGGENDIMPEVSEEMLLTKEAFQALENDILGISSEDMMKTVSYDEMKEMP